MYLSKHKIGKAERWAADGKLLPSDFDLKEMLALTANEIKKYLSNLKTSDEVHGEMLAPIEYDQEVWACGVTYSRSRDAREAETDVKDIYDKVYEAERPELLFKDIGWRAKGNK